MSFPLIAQEKWDILKVGQNYLHWKDLKKFDTIDIHSRPLSLSCKILWFVVRLVTGTCLCEAGKLIAWITKSKIALVPVCLFQDCEQSKPIFCITESMALVRDSDCPQCLVHMSLTQTPLSFLLKILLWAFYEISFSTYIVNSNTCPNLDRKHKIKLWNLIYSTITWNV